MFLFVVLGLLVYADETQEQQVERLIKLLQGQNGGVRKNAASTLGSIGEGAINAVPALVQALKDQDQDVRRNAATALIRIGTPEALKAVKEYGTGSRNVKKHMYLS